MAKAASKSTPRYAVGIDLGTTNSAVASAPLDGEQPAPIEVLAIPQLIEPGEVAPRTLLPSFLYLAGDLDFPAGSLTLPWGESRQVAGELARKRGAESPDRLVASAKHSHGTVSIVYYLCFVLFSILIASSRGGGFRSGVRLTIATSILFLAVEWATGSRGPDFDLNRLVRGRSVCWSRAI